MTDHHWHVPLPLVHLVLGWRWIDGEVLMQSGGWQLSSPDEHKVWHDERVYLLQSSEGVLRENGLSDQTVVWSNAEHICEFFAVLLALGTSSHKFSCPAGHQSEAVDPFLVYSPWIISKLVIIFCLQFHIKLHKIIFNRNLRLQSALHLPNQRKKEHLKMYI